MSVHVHFDINGTINAKQKSNLFQDTHTVFPPYFWIGPGPSKRTRLLWIQNF